MKMIYSAKNRKLPSKRANLKIYVDGVIFFGYTINRRWKNYIYHHRKNRKQNKERNAAEAGLPRLWQNLILINGGFKLCS